MSSDKSPLIDFIEKEIMIWVKNILELFHICLLFQWLIFSSCFEVCIQKTYTEETFYGLHIFSS